MPKEVSLDYIAYLNDKWKRYLLRGDPYHQAKRERYGQLVEMIDEMKNETKAGKMLYHYLKYLHSKSPEEQKAYRIHQQKYR